MQRAIFVHDRPWTSIKSRNCWCSCFDQRPFCLLGATWAGSIVARVEILMGDEPKMTSFLVEDLDEVLELSD